MEWFRRSVSKLGSWAEELFHCPYCLSHWLAIGGVLAWFEDSIFELVIYIMVVVTLSSLASLGITHFFIALDALEEGSEE
jgi:CHASE2 domain-containing sensor protein